MRKHFLGAARNFLRKLDIGIVRQSTLEVRLKNLPATTDLKILQRLNSENSQQLLHYFSKSKSQLRQDLFVLSHFGFKRNGFFVEFGATNGLRGSNTHLMEKELGWTGILAEPATCWHKNLKENRDCFIETDCVWKDSNSILTFNEADAAGLSTIDIFSNSDKHANRRKQGKTYEVKTISLNDLLKKYDAPKNIDYLSIDTEGSEYEILSSFDFAGYDIGVLTVEHNFTAMREKLFLLLSGQGYQRVFEDISRFDDWYIKES